ncbi:MAG: hypothetical protein ABIP79_17670 [Chitinophagaceae bacterium]
MSVKSLKEKLISKLKEIDDPAILEEVPTFLNYRNLKQYIR